MATLQLLGLSPGTHYYIQLRADDGTQVSEWSRRFDLVTGSDTTPPDVPLWATVNDFVVDGDTFVANWQPVDISLAQNMDFSHYELVLTANSISVTIKMTNTSYVLSFEQNRIFFGSPQPIVQAKIRSLDTNGNASAYTSTKTATNPAPSNVASVVVQSVYDGLQISWPAVTDIDLSAYRVQISTTSSTSGYSTVYQGPDLTYTYYTILYATDHYVRVYAIDKFGTVSVSPITSGAVRPKSGFTVDTTPPANPTGVTATASFNTTTNESYIDLSWTANSETDLAGYVVRYSQVSGSWVYVNLDKSATGTRIVVIPGASYYVGVAAKDMSNNISGYSTPTPNPVTSIADTTAPSTPTAPTVSVNTLQAQVVIPGTKAAGGAMESDVSYYEVYGSTTTGFTPASASMLGQIQNGPAIIGTFDIPASGASGSTQSWFFKIIAVDRSGNKSVASAQATGSVGLIATANISDLAVTNAKINDLVANKITAGTGFINDLIVKSKFTLGDASTVGYIESYDYTTSSGATGFQFSKNGLIIKTGSIEAAALKLQDSANIMPYGMADFELPEIYYIDNTKVPSVATNLNWSSLTSATITLDGAVSRFGLKSLKVVQSAATGRTIYLAPSSTVNNIFFPNDGGQYFVSMWVKPTVTNALTLTFANGNTTHTTATAKRAIDDVTTLTTGVWQQVYLLTTAVSLDTGNVRIVLPAVAGTWNIDGVQVERKVGASTKPGAYSPPSVTTIDGGQIKTGSIQSSNLGQVWDPVTQTFSAGTAPSWSIDLQGDAVFSNLSILGNVIVGDQSDLVNSKKYIAMSAFYSPGSAGWMLRGDGYVEFNQILTNTLDGSAIRTGSLAADTLSSGTLGADINVVGGGFTLMAADGVTPVINLDTTVGLVIDPPGTGYINIPVNGDALQIKNVSLSATDATFNGNVSIYGSANYIAGDVVLEQSVSDPSVAPTVVSGWSDPSTYMATTPPAGYATFGLCEDTTGSYWVTGIFAASAKNAQIWRINKTTGAYSALVGATIITRSAASGNFSTDPLNYFVVHITTGADIFRGVGKIVVGATTYYAEFVHYPAQSGTATGHNLVLPSRSGPVSYSFPAYWAINLYAVGNSDGTAPDITWTYTPGASTSNPFMHSDGTNFYIAAASSISPYNFTVTRYAYDGTSPTVVASTTGGGVNTSVSSLWYGSADIGSPRWLIGGSMTSFYSLSGVSVANDTATAFPIANGETQWGLWWDGTQFRSINGAGKIYKHSTYTGATVSRAVGYAWYDSDATGGTHESMLSPTKSITSNRRGWIKTTVPAPRDNGGTDDPDTVRIYIDSIQQAAVTPGVLSVVYGPYNTSGTGPQGSNQFLSLPGGGIIRTKSVTGGSATISIKGDGTWTWDPTATSQVVCTAASTATTTGVVAITGWSITLTVPSTDAVYIIDFDPDLSVNAGSTAIVQLYIDGANPGLAQLIHVAPANNQRAALHKRYRVTGLSAGSHTFAGRLSLTAAGSATVNQTHSLMTIQRVA